MVFGFQWIYGQDPPVEFEFSQSTLQAFYFFDEVTLNGIPLESDDWVAAFNGDVCVGARQWDVDNCGGGLCDVPAMGNDGSTPMAGYMQMGDTPTFKVYDVSANSFFDAIVSEETDSWSINFFSQNDLLRAGWFMNPSDYQFNGSVTSKVFIDEQEVGTELDVLSAFIGDEVRGVISGLEVPTALGGGFSFNIMIFSNDINSELITFKYYDSSNGSIIDLNESMEFKSDMIVGSVTDPFILSGNSIIVLGCVDVNACNYDEYATSTDGSCEYVDVCGVCGGEEENSELCLSNDFSQINSFTISNVYPNPFNPVVNIDINCDVAEHLDLSIYSVAGKPLDNIYSGIISAGKSTFSWAPENQASGCYLINALIDNQVKTEKVLFLK